MTKGCKDVKFPDPKDSFANDEQRSDYSKGSGNSVPTAPKDKCLPTPK